MHHVLRYDKRLKWYSRDTLLRRNRLVHNKQLVRRLHHQQWFLPLSTRVYYSLVLLHHVIQSMQFKSWNNAMGTLVYTSRARSVTRCKGRGDGRNFHHQDDVTRSLPAKRKLRAGGKTEWREVGRRETCVWTSDTEALRPFEVPEVSPEASRIYVRMYTYSSAVRIIVDVVRGQKKRRRKDATLCPGNQRNFASSGLPRFPSDAESALVTVDLLKSLTSTSFYSEDRYYQFCAAVNDDQWCNYHDFHRFKIRHFRFIIALRITVSFNNYGDVNDTNLRSRSLERSYKFNWTT